MRIEIPVPPGGTNRLWRNVNGKVIVNPKAKEWKQEVQFIAYGSQICLHVCPVSVSIEYAPKKRKKETDAPLRRLDVDGVIKPVLDALQGIAYLNDYQVVSVSSRIVEPVNGGKLTVSMEPA